MLGERIEINLKIEDRDIPLKLNVRSLKNLSELTRLNPFKYLYDFIHTKDEEDKNQMLVNILLAFTDANLTVEDLPRILDQNQQMDYYLRLYLLGLHYLQNHKVLVLRLLLQNLYYSYY